MCIKCERFRNELKIIRRSKQTNMHEPNGMKPLMQQPSAIGTHSHDEFDSTPKLYAATIISHMIDLCARTEYDVYELWWRHSLHNRFARGKNFREFPNGILLELPIFFLLTFFGQSGENFKYEHCDADVSKRLIQQTNQKWIECSR